MRGLTAALCVTTGAFGLAACGGGERQDAAEPSGSFKLEITGADFPKEQSIAQASTMKISVRNADTKKVPNVAVTVATDPGDTPGAPQAFSNDIQNADVADASRPIWIVDEAPSGGDTAYTNTWALGELKPGESKDFEWKVTAVKAGDYTIKYSVSPGLTGKAKPASGATKGTFEVKIDDTPPDARVDDDGNVIIGSGSDDEN